MQRIVKNEHTMKAFYTNTEKVYHQKILTKEIQKDIFQADIKLSQMKGVRMRRKMLLLHG